MIDAKNMGYYLDLGKITIDDYRARLAAAYLPPSRMILKEGLDERLGYFKSIGIGLGDVRILIDSASELPQEIE